MITDRLSSGLPISGRSELPGFDKNLGKSEHKSPDAFAEIMHSARTPQKDKPESGKIEDSPRTHKNLAVKDSKDKGDDSPVERKAKGDEPVVKAKSTKKGQSQRQQAMQEFMDSMESEFSIPPDRIAEAMVSLKDEDLIKSPEETASQVIQKLDLDSEQESKAEAMYVSMLAKLSKTDQQPEIKKSEIEMLPMHEQLAAMQIQSQMGPPQKGSMMQDTAQTMISEKQRRSQLNDSLDRLSQKFFLTGSEARISEQPVDQQAMGQSQFNPMLLDRMQPTSAYLDQNKEFDLKDFVPVKPDMQSPIQQLPEQQLQEGNYQELAEKLATLNQTSQDLGIAMKAGPKNLKALQLEQALANQYGQAEFAPAQMMKQSMNGESSSGFDKHSGAGKQQSSDLEVMSTTTGQPDSKTGEFFVQPKMMDAGQHMGATAATSATGAVRPQQAEENIRHIMNQAQYMMKKGGGESIVRLSPEGLGELHLKVAVNDGKVNLTMAAETKEAKSLIESSLSDLKTNLSSHNLKVESIKVDVGNQLSSDNNNSQTQSGFKFDQNREQARQFLSNFHDENSGNRGLYYESPAMKAYGAPKSPEPLRPSDEAQSRARRYSGEGRGNGLNLVA